MRWLLVLVAGCGRLEFDPLGTLDAARDATPLANHDEDADGVDDALDVCPHLVDDQSDLDGDGVGDVCDPAPSQPRQSRQLFFAMTADNAPAPNIDWQQNADAWRFSMDVIDGFFELPAVLDNADTWIGFDLIEILPTPARQLFASVQNGSSRHYYGEIYDDGTMAPRETLLYFDGNTSVFFDNSVSLGTSIPLGRMDYRLTTRMAGPMIALDMTWPPTTFHTELTPGDASSFVGGNLLHIDARSLTVEVRYIFIVTTVP